MNPFLLLILFVIIGSCLLEIVVTALNLKAMSPELPEEFKDIYDDRKYAESQRYTREASIVGIVTTLFITTTLLIFMIAGGFNTIDGIARSAGMGSIYTGLIFSGLLFLMFTLINLPFDLYSTFVIEEKFGFNRMSLTTFFSDLLKTLLLSMILGGFVLAGILWFFETCGQSAWIWCWGGVFSFMIVMQFLAPVLIMPLFNRFTPLEEGSLKEKIEKYAEKENFKMKGIYTMDGSKRSTRLNAFFAGAGSSRRIVFYDTLLEKLSDSEIVAVLAHEMGHFKLKHTTKLLVASAVQTGVMFWLLSLFLNNKLLFQAFGMEHVSIYASIVFFGFLFSPLSMLITMVFNIFSRRYEYEADAYAAREPGFANALISALKKLCRENLSNLTPHPMYVFLNYTHPPVLERIRRLNNLRIKSLTQEDMVQPEYGKLSI